MFSYWRKKRVYLDYAAATPVRPEVLSVMQPYFSVHFANPGAIHQEGQLAKRAVEAARHKVSRTLGVRDDDITWTASGTESNNLAIYGLLRQLTEEEGKSFRDLEIITTEIEHPSILEVCDHLKSHGLKVNYVPVTEDGRIDKEKLTELLSPTTALVTFAYVNSEIGTIEDVKGITRLIRKFNDERGAQVKVHLDAAQAPLWLPCKLEQLGVDLLSLDAGKCYGPKGVGVLAKRHHTKLKPVVLGGGQERGLRSGTENVPLIVGAAEAIEIAQDDFEKRAERAAAIRDYAIEKLTAIAGVGLNGSESNRVANNINVAIEGVEAEFAAVTLDVAGIACSTKSACGAGTGGGSSVVRSISGSDDKAQTSLRFTLGEESTEAEIDRLIVVLDKHISDTRKFQTNSLTT